MRKIQFGKTDLKISSLGLGTMYFGTKVDEKIAFSLLDYYVQLGGNVLDTANKYASWIHGFVGGESETVIAHWLKIRKNREDVVLCSKVGFQYGETPRSLKPDIIRSECEKSLNRLGVDCIDIYYAHAFDFETPLEEVMYCFWELKKAGKIKYAAASNFQLNQLREANSIAQKQGWEGFVSIQNFYTYLKPIKDADFGNQVFLTAEIHNYCKNNNLPIFGYSPLLGGVYSDLNRKIPVQFYSGISLKQREIVMLVANELKVSPNAVIIHWLSEIYGIIPLVSASSMSQLTENLNSESITFTNEQLKLLSH